MTKIAICYIAMKFHVLWNQNSDWVPQSFRVLAHIPAGSRCRYQGPGPSRRICASWWWTYHHNKLTNRPMVPSLWQKECTVHLLFQVFENLTFHRTKFWWANKVDKLCQMTGNELPLRQQAEIWWQNLSRSRETRRRLLRGKLLYHSWVIWLYNQQVHPHIPPLIWASSSLHHIQKSSSIHVSPLSTK